ncbi:alpha/beta hydrolase [Rhodococcus sp. 06-418-5]|uniref:alpha/beta fold hydrolase n=1 Tax=Rhodococcus sp. 06-418-5 TaxID=2022507 RepID=UPI000B9B8F7F|nr:alpha/beta hydrolase [Rhodococcus sp. 06-418-5]OZC85097.1 alpha/beta hydrolase [Rhodococcus sp. 06-418-5]OZC85144.1 alpha/beta hydrolase [Rhodococcus sp. 06-418-5]
MHTTASDANTHTAREHCVAGHGDVRIGYVREGDGPTIVILPSLARGSADYDDVAPLLAARGFRVIRPDPRGIGESTGPMNGLNLHHFAADVAAVLDHEQCTGTVVVGHAWGSQPARMLAMDRPDLVSGLVMAAASAGKMPPGSNEKPYSRLRDAIDGAGNLDLPDEVRMECLRQAFFAPGHDPSSWMTGWSTSTHHAQSHARNITPIDEYFAGGTVPILDLQAEHDAVVIPNIFKPMLGERVTESVIADAAHALAPEQPEAFAEAIASFAHSVLESESRTQ